MSDAPTTPYLALKARPGTMAAKLEVERARRRYEVAKLRNVHRELTDLLAYLASDKFQGGPENDVIHVRTDLWPRLKRLEQALFSVEGYETIPDKELDDE